MSIAMSKRRSNSDIITRINSRLIWESLRITKVSDNQWESWRIGENHWESGFRLIQESMRINSRLIQESSRIGKNHRESVRISKNHWESKRINFRLIQESVKIIENQFHTYSRISENHIKIRSYLFDGPRPNDTDKRKSMYL